MTRWTLEIPTDKLDDISKILNSWLHKKKAKLRDIQSLVGKLNFLATCVRPGRIFMCRILNWLRDIYNENGLIKIPPDVKKDIIWWNMFLPHYNGVFYGCGRMVASWFSNVIWCVYQRMWWMVQRKIFSQTVPSIYFR